MKEGERQVSPTLDGIRADHTNRYYWASARIDGREYGRPAVRLTDAACGIGYGSKILADAGYKVRAIDVDEEAIVYARRHYAHPNISYQCLDIDRAGPFLSDYTIAFEMIEHIENPLPFLKQVEGKLLASVPNEAVFPYRGYAFHFRHYTQKEFEDLLNQAGFKVESWWGQEGPESDVIENMMGRTIIAECSR